MKEFARSVARRARNVKTEAVLPRSPKGHLEPVEKLGGDYLLTQEGLAWVFAPGIEPEIVAPDEVRSLFEANPELAIVGRPRPDDPGASFEIEGLRDQETLDPSVVVIRVAHLQVLDGLGRRYDSWPGALQHLIERSLRRGFRVAAAPEILPAVSGPVQGPASSGDRERLQHFMRNTALNVEEPSVGQLRIQINAAPRTRQLLVPFGTDPQQVRRLVELGWTVVRADGNGVIDPRVSGWPDAAIDAEGTLTAALPDGRRLTIEEALAGTPESLWQRVNHEPAAPVRFVIICPSRSGSGMLVRTLDSHPNIRCQGEIYDNSIELPVQEKLKRHEEWRARDARIHSDPVRVLKDEIFAGDATLARGFKAKYQVIDHPLVVPVIEAIRNDASIHVIHLTRRNLLGRHLSQLRVKETGVYHVGRQGEVPKVARVTVDAQRLELEFRRTLIRERHARSLFASNPVLEISYEDLTDDMDRAFEAIQRFLGVDVVPLTPQTKKIAQRPLSADIVNWESISGTFEGTVFAPLFEAG